MGVRRIMIVLLFLLTAQRDKKIMCENFLRYRYMHRFNQFNDVQAIQKCQYKERKFLRFRGYVCI